MDNLLVKMSAEFPDRRNKLIFMINNYDLVLLILNVGVTRTDWPFLCV